MIQRKAAAPGATRNEQHSDERVYTLEVVILDGPITDRFRRKNKVISRTIQIRGDQTLEALHQAIFDAFDREEEHMYEFQVGGEEPHDPSARSYVLPMALESTSSRTRPAPNDVTRNCIGALGLGVGDRFGYWFDFGDDWWHEIECVAIETVAPRGRLPRVTKRVGKSPPQYVDRD